MHLPLMQLCFPCASVTIECLKVLYSCGVTKAMVCEHIGLYGYSCADLKLLPKVRALDLQVLEYVLCVCYNRYYLNRRVFSNCH